MVGDGDANARLIAAAPDLLAACKGLLRIADAWGRSEFEDPDQQKKMLAMLNPFRDIIAKAEPTP
jgi:hypothetical protein